MPRGTKTELTMRVDCGGKTGATKESKYTVHGPDSKKQKILGHKQNNKMAGHHIAKKKKTTVNGRNSVSYFVKSNFIFERNMK